jgi:hypothetical protein
MAVDSTHPEYDAVTDKRQRVRDALDADKVREAGTRYLPKLSGMENPDYESYKMRAPYFGATHRTLQGVSGLVFRRDIQTTLPDANGAADLIKDMNGKGVNLDRFAQTVFDEACSIGGVGVYVTLPQMAAAGARAYMSCYKAESVVNWEDITVEGRQITKRVVLKERATIRDEADPYKRKHIEQWRDAYLDDAGLLAVDVWRKATDIGIGRQGFVVVEHHEPRFRGIRLRMIPFVPINARSIGFTPEEPPMLALADANLDHWRQMADYRWSQHNVAAATTTVIAADGFSPKEVKYGPGTILTIPTSDAKVFNTEFSGQGLQPQRDAIADTVGHMAALGAGIIAPEKSAAETAETHRLKQGRESATIASTVQTVSDGLSMATTLMINLSGIPGDVSVELNSDLVDSKLSPDELRAVVEAYQAQAMSFETMHYNLQRGEMTRPGIDPDDEKALIDVQAPQLPEMTFGE